MLNRPRDLLGGFYSLVHPLFREIKSFFDANRAKPDE